MNWIRILTSLIFVFFLFSAGCRQSENKNLVNQYKYFDAGINDIPALNKIEAILITPHYHPELFYGEKNVYIIGNPEKVEEIIGHEILAKKAINDPSWLQRITTNFKNAKRTKKWSSKGSFSEARAIFVTKEKAYMVLIDKNDDGDNKVICGPDYESIQLRKDFEEIGLLSEYSKPPDMNEVINALKGGPPGVDPNRIKEAQERLRQEAERMKKEKEANQP
ncbi:hypothetical protein L21SP3_00285 [Sedimentisphaera cyanobacteriorum]|uniref:Lipoprotein n=1 Tax=Sedimentisphaera cyanobacteriorum TaxID=1940790 RepID=A0A1Q2HM30_9BACT|nr:hypothetical protein [Sedimentisphaera cyanobacteriorum]AQQ08502.1 hypothetical protein L21SP3_00285 [Sedimentisphaera cyanobacteriorum]